MSDNQSWYARKLAEIQGRPAVPPPQQHPQQYQQRTPPTTWSPQNRSTIAVQTIEQAEPYPTVYDPNLTPGQNAAKWRGGEATRHETAACPQCNSANYFSRTNGVGGRHTRKPPAPHCFDCGYNGIFEQFGNSDADYR